MRKPKKTFFLKKTIVLSMCFLLIFSTTISAMAATAVTENLTDTNGKYTITTPTDSANITDGSLSGSFLTVGTGERLAISGDVILEKDSPSGEFAVHIDKGGKLFIGGKHLDRSSNADPARVPLSSLQADNMSLEDDSSLILDTASLTISNGERLHVNTESDVILHDSSITVDSDKLIFDGKSTFHAASGNNYVNSNVSLKDSFLIVGENDPTPNYGMYADLIISGDLIIAASDPSTISITPNSTLIVGGTFTAENITMTQGTVITSKDSLFSGALNQTTPSLTLTTTAGTELTASTNSGTVYAQLLDTDTFTLEDVYEFDRLLTNQNAAVGGGFRGGVLNLDPNQTHASTADLRLPDASVPISGAPVTAGTATISGHIELNEFQIQSTVAIDTVSFTNGGGVGSALNAVVGGVSTAIRNIEVNFGTTHPSDRHFYLGKANSGVNFDLDKVSIIGGDVMSTFDIVGGTHSIDSLTVDNDKLLFRVGQLGEKGILITENIDINGSGLVVDPTWVEGMTDAQNGSYVSEIDANVNGTYIAGRNSVITSSKFLGAFGYNYWTQRINELGGLYPFTNSAVLGIGQNIVLEDAQGGIVVDGQVTQYESAKPGSVTLAHNALVIVNAARSNASLNFKINPDSANYDSNQALIADSLDGNIDVSFATANAVNAAPAIAFDNMNLDDPRTVLDESKMVFIQNATITSLGTTSANTYLADEDNVVIYNNDYMLKTVLTQDATTSDIIANTSLYQPSVDIYDESAGILTQMYAQGLNNYFSDSIGARFLSRAGAKNYAHSAEDGARTVGGAVRLASVGAAPQITVQTSEAGTSAVYKRITSSPENIGIAAITQGSDGGLSSGDKAEMKNGLGLWISPLYKSANAWNLDAGKYDTGYNANFGGVAIGGDYTFDNAFRLGLTFNVGAGYSESNGDFADTQNYFDFWGIGVYGGWYKNDFAILGHVNYTGSSHEITQDGYNPIGMGDITSDINTSAFNVGLRAEYTFKTDALNITPYVGVEYMSLYTNDYEIEMSGGTAFDGDSIHQSIWTFPIGVILSKEIETGSGWKFSPRLELGIIPAAGDVHANAYVKVPNADLSIETEARIVDDFSYMGSLGFDFGNDDFGIRLDYTYIGSKHSSNHGVQASFRFDF